ncbi:SDR family oxidoreductase [Mesorhizobium sp. YM1C-6-2]|uniref:SDR family oxidoreductase n=1 Tax=Mesorhizobium sp. YM1C-6-2 TaxID=1827501 RepID=UPI000EF1D0CE|nr:SDR family oxidoreductase [Mesorhizobium sp. YM1C-6-2]RLP26660.1 SDR family oxidoreductase [Mesorhizobium sp. YM1C-6-2]
MSELFSLKGRLALVTGSGQGIGFALAKGLAEHGAIVVVNGRSADKVEKAVASLRGKGLKVEGSVFDVVDAAAVEAEVARIEKEIGPIDIVVNNAGMQFRKSLEEFPDDKWQAMLQTNVTGVFNVGKAAAKRMIPRRRGKIINIGSVMSELARTTIAPYTATKGAVRNLTRGMCADWAKHGLQVNAIAPGFFRTELNTALFEDPEFNAWLEKRTPTARWGEVEELVGAAVFLASDASSFVNGHTLYVDGGLTTSV